MLIDNRRFVVRRYKILTKQAAEPLRLIFITDLHENVYGKYEDNAPVIAAIRREQPNLVIIGGDMISSADAAKSEQGVEWHRNSEQLIRSIASEYPLLFVNGNHEIRVAEGRMGDHAKNENIQYEKALEECGVQFLHNSSAEYFNMKFFGLELPASSYKKFKLPPLEKDQITERIGASDRVHFSILITHDPAHFPKYAQWGADLVLCGHLHGGIGRLPFIGGIISPTFRLFPKYSGGLYKYKAQGGRISQMVLSCGMGMHTLKIRFFNPAELSVIDILPG